MLYYLIPIIAVIFLIVIFRERIQKYLIKLTVKLAYKLPSKSKEFDSDGMNEAFDTALGMFITMTGDEVLAKKQMSEYVLPMHESEMFKRYKANPNITPEELIESFNSEYLDKLSELGIDSLELSRQVKQSM